MTIDKKLIHFKTWNNFILQGVGSEENITTPTSGKEEDGTAIYGQIKGTSIVFIKDVGKIWTHGKVYCADQDLSEYVTDSELENLLVFGKGEAENSAVLKGEYQGYSNTAISQTSIAIGAATTAGLKGWYYSKVDFNTKQITISDRQPTVLLNNLINGNWNSGTLNIQAGDIISIVNNSKYDKCSKVSNVNGNVITVESLPFTKLDLSIISANNPDDWSIYIAERPNAGIIDFGGGALAEGVNTKSTNIGSHAEGIQTHAYGQYSHTEGFKTAAGYSAHAEGKESTASGEQSHAEGFSTHAIGNNSHAEGKETYATQYSAHAEGYGTVAGDSTSPVIENTSPAEGCYTHAEGNGTRAVGHSSHAEGRGSVAQGKMSHAEGLGTKAIGNASHAEGNKTVANGSSSHAEGLGTVTNNVGEHACGSYNVSNTDTIFSVGIGSSDTNRKNAIEINKNGEILFYKNADQVSLQDELAYVKIKKNDFHNNTLSISDERLEKLIKINEIHLLVDYYEHGERVTGSLIFKKTNDETNNLGRFIEFSYCDEWSHDILTIDITAKNIKYRSRSMQARLVSGENIKTINGTSILGEGDITMKEDLI